MKLAGLSEIADLYGFSRQAALKLSRRDDFPKPLDRVKAGPIWDMADVRRHHRSWSRKR